MFPYPHPHQYPYPHQYGYGGWAGQPPPQRHPQRPPPPLGTAGHQEEEEEEDPRSLQWRAGEETAAQGRWREGWIQKQLSREQRRAVAQRLLPLEAGVRIPHTEHRHRDRDRRRGRGNGGQDASTPSPHWLSRTTILLDGRRKQLSQQAGDLLWSDFVVFNSAAMQIQRVWRGFMARKRRALLRQQRRFLDYMSHQGRARSLVDNLVDYFLRKHIVPDLFVEILLGDAATSPSRRSVGAPSPLPPPKTREERARDFVLDVLLRDLLRGVVKETIDDIVTRYCRSRKREEGESEQLRLHRDFGVNISDARRMQMIRDQVLSEYIRPLVCTDVKHAISALVSEHMASQGSRTFRKPTELGQPSQSRPLITQVGGKAVAEKEEEHQSRREQNAGIMECFQHNIKEPLLEAMLFEVMLTISETQRDAAAGTPHRTPLRE